MKPIHMTMVFHAMVLVLFGLWALSATQHRHPSQPAAICDTDSDCARFGGNGDPAPQWQADHTLEDLNDRSFKS